MLADSHCHLDHCHGDLEQVINAARAAGVAYLLTVSINLASFPQILKIAKSNTNIFATVGVQPNESDDHEAAIEELLHLASDPLVVGIGETGLDNYHHDISPKIQVERFRNHIRAAKEISKPLIIHTREAKSDTIKILREEKAEAIGGVIHCFSEDLATANEFLDMGFYISFSGIITYPASNDLRSTVKHIPLERILIETDAPYLTPQPVRGDYNQPAFVKYVAEYLAQTKEISFESVAEQTTANFLQLFKSDKAHAVSNLD